MINFGKDELLFRLTFISMSTQEKIILEFKKKFGVHIVADKDKLEIGIRYNRADEERVNEYVESFLVNELSIYSSAVLKISTLSRIILSKNLTSLDIMTLSGGSERRHPYPPVVRAKHVYYSLSFSG